MMDCPAVIYPEPPKRNNVTTLRSRAATPLLFGDAPGGTSHQYQAELVVVMTLEQACPPEYRRAQCAFKDSMIHDFCNSHYLSHFAAFFIDARTKRSVVESFSYLFLYSDNIVSEG